MNLEALIAALVPGRTGGGREPVPEPHQGSPGFQDWLQHEGDHLPLPRQAPAMTKLTREIHSIGKAIGDSATRRAADLTPAANGSAVAFAERPILVETSLEFGARDAGFELRSDHSDIRWIGEVLQYRVGDFLQARAGKAHPGWPGPSPSPLAGPPDEGHRPGPAEKHLPVFRMVPVTQTAAAAGPQSDVGTESVQPETWRRGRASGALAARLMEHFGRITSDGPLVQLHPEQDGLWRLFLRLPKLAEGALAELREELKGLVEAYGLTLGTFEVVETQTGEGG